MNSDGQTIALQPGTYLVNYSANVTGATGSAELAYYLDGTQVTASLSTQSVDNTSQTVNLSNQHILVTSGNSSLTFRNPGANNETVTNLVTNITKLA